MASAKLAKGWELIVADKIPVYLCEKTQTAQYNSPGPKVR